MENEKSVGKLGKGKHCMILIWLKEKSIKLSLLIKYLHLSLVSNLNTNGHVTGSKGVCTEQSSVLIGQISRRSNPCHELVSSSHIHVTFWDCFYSSQCFLIFICFLNSPHFK